MTNPRGLHQIVPPLATGPGLRKVLLVAFLLPMILLSRPGWDGYAQEGPPPEPEACPPCPDDGNQCTLEYCIGDSCVHDPGPKNNMACNDGNQCTLGDKCSAGTCFPGNIPRSCNDGSSCTDDRCDSLTGCVFTPMDRFCSDGNPCTAGDWCVAGACTPMGVATCNDGNECTIDTCTTPSGCHHDAASGSCDDGSTCTAGDHCEAGVCSGVSACPCPDADSDGRADCRVVGCDQTGVLCGDCDDGDAAVHPGATDLCNQRDDDCNGTTDDGFDRQPVLLRKFTDPEGHDGDRFGSSIAPLGDVDGDGVGDIAIGAVGATTAQGSEAGVVVLVSGAELSVICRAVDPAGRTNARLGSAVAGIGDVTGDGVPDLAAGAPGQSKVAIFSGTDCAPLLVCGDSKTINHGFPIFSQQSEGIVGLGATLAAPGDLNGDAIPDIAAGAPASRASSPFTAPFFSVGSLSLLSGASCHRIAGTSGSTEGARFASSMAVLPDITGDGVSDLAVGEVKPSWSTSGGVSLVSGASGSILRGLKNPAGSSDDLLGTGVAPLRNAAGGTLLAIAAGASQDDTAAGVNAGSVSMFDPAGAILRTCIDPDGAADDQLGLGLAEIPDIDGDGFPEIVAAAPLDDGPTGINAGSVVIFSGADCTSLAKLTDDTAQADARFGSALARLTDLDGDGSPDFGVGQPLDNAGGSDRGSVLLFQARSDCPETPPPVAVASAPAMVECGGPAGGPVTLDGSASHGGESPAGEGLASLDWYEDYGGAGQAHLGSGAVLQVTLPLGTHAVTLVVTDDQGATGSDDVTIAVQDTQAPALAVLADPFVLWPPNHEMTPVGVLLTATDLCDPAPVVAMVSVGCSEPDDAPGTGDGATLGDIEGADIGTADTTLHLRAERGNDGAGRVYTLTYSVTDASGNATPALGVVTVPRDQGSGPEPLLIRVEPGANGSASRLYWPSVPEALSYDVIRGEVGRLRFEAGRVRLGPVEPIALGLTATAVDEPPDAQVPPLGAAWFYLVQYHTEWGPVGYGTESAPGPREPE